MNCMSFCNLNFHIFVLKLSHKKYIVYYIKLILIFVNKRQQSSWFITLPWIVFLQVIASNSFKCKRLFVFQNSTNVLLHYTYRKFYITLTHWHAYKLQRTACYKKNLFTTIYRSVIRVFHARGVVVKSITSSQLQFWLLL